MALETEVKSASMHHNISSDAPSIAQHSSSLQALLVGESGNLVGAAIAVADIDGDIKFATIGPSNSDEGDEMVSVDTPFPLWSTTKLLTATLVCQLVDEGTLTLDDLITQSVPESAPMFPFGHPTLRQLMSHSAGLVDIFEPTTEASSFIARVAGLGPIAAPGEILSYTNTAYILLGILLTTVTGQDWPSLVRSRILNPLGLQKIQLGDETSSTKVPVAKDHEFASDGSVFVKELFPRKLDLMAAAGTTAAAPIGEAAILMSAILLGTGPGLLSAKMRATMQSMVISMPGPSTFCEGWGVGWGIQDDCQGLVGHMGAAASYVMGSSKLGKVAVFLSNTPAMTSPKAPGAIIGKPLLYEALGIRAPAANPSRQGIELKLPSSVPGTYSSPLFSFEIVQNGHHLEARSALSEEATVLEQLSALEFKGKVGTMWTEFNFVATESDSPPRFLHVALRAIKRA